jgi:hypothetical protein
MDLNTFFIVMGKGGVQQLVGGIVVYAYLAFTLMVLANRIGVKNSWLAWVPIANMYLMTKMANLPWWWILGFFIPFLNFLIAGYIWSEIGKRFGKAWWIGALVVIPMIGLIVPGYFVVTTGSTKPAEPTQV